MTQQGAQSLSSGLLGPFVLDRTAWSRRTRAVGTLVVMAVLYNVSWGLCLFLEVCCDGSFIYLEECRLGL